ncbi:MAG: glycosyltransferase [Verrucomicrobiales bacterium]|nr:glycosyltransferase [Verrucomicrobiales bacterium]
MKVLINCPVPFMLAHGGAQTQIEQTVAALKHNGVEADFVRWWDGGQQADLIHFWGRMPADHIKLAQQKGIKVVIGELLTAQGSRTPGQLRLQKFISRSVQRFAPGSFAAAFNWDSYRLADAVIAMTPWEKHLMNYMFGAALEKIFIVPNGVEEVFLTTPKTGRGQWLVCTATITPRKRVLELAQAAVHAQTPLWIIGRAYAESDPYARQFYALARQHPQLICTDSPPMADRAGLAKIYRAARGFVLLSAMETRSLAAEEAAACECPLLLSDLPWARSTFESSATYCTLTKSVDATAAALRKFYDAAPNLPLPPKPPAWNEIGRQLKTIYERVLNAAG